MKRHFLINPVAAVLIVLTAACSNNPDCEPVIPGDAPAATPVTIRFGGGMDTGTDGAAGPGTRVTYDPTADGGFNVLWKGGSKTSGPDKVGIFALQQAADGTLAEVSGAKNVRYYATASAVRSPFEPYSTALTGCTAGNTYTFCSYCPYSSSSTTTYNQVSTPGLMSQSQSAPDNTDHLSALDLTYAVVKDVTPGNGNDPLTVTFGYQHAFSMLQFEVTNHLGEEVKVQNIRLARQDGASEIIYSAKLSLTDGSFSDLYKTKTQALTVGTPAVLSAGAAQKFWMMIFPGYAGQELELTVTTDKGTYILGKTAPADGGFAAGQTYTVGLTLAANPATGRWIPFSNNAWHLDSPEDLRWFTQKVNSGSTTGLNAVLDADITLPAGAWPGIGTNSYKYKGTFDGNGKTITLHINAPNGTEYEGLFRYLASGAKVQNLTVGGTISGTLSAARYIGGIAAYNDGGSITNCASTVQITATAVKSDGRFGGIAGMNIGTISQCYASGSVTIPQGKCGGIAGSNTSIISDCYSTASVSINNAGYVAGICGMNSGTITHCYATGTMKTGSSGTAAGIAGQNQTGGTITGCAALNSSITGGINYTYAIAFNKATVTDCIRYSGIRYGTSGTGTPGDASAIPAKSHTECLTRNTYTALGWTFDADTWGFTTGHLPYLQKTPGSQANAPALPAAN